MNGDADSPTASGQSRTELCLVAPFSEAAFGKHLFGVVGGKEDLLAELRSRTSLSPWGQGGGTQSSWTETAGWLTVPTEPGHPFSPLPPSNSTFSFSKELREPLKQRVGVPFLASLLSATLPVQRVMEILPQALDEQTGSQQRAWQLAVAQLSSARGQERL